MRLARSGAELADPLGVVAATAWAANDGSVEQMARIGHGFVRWSDAKGLQPATALVGKPLARPRRR